jgi:L-aminopeptidase/D-esterase-like protein
MPLAITDVPGILVGHAQDDEALTGCTVVLTIQGAVGGVDVRGGGPGTRETDLLNPISNVTVVHAIALCGGSAFGLAAATGVVDWLREHDIGYQTPICKVPIVPAAVIFDLGVGRSDRWADAALGYAACDAARSGVVEGCVGVGAGASVGKLLGMNSAVKSGIGTWSEVLADGTTIGALVVCNAIGDVYEEETGEIIAGARDPQTGSLVNSMALLRSPLMQKVMSPISVGENTTLAVVATDARLTKAEVTKLAQMAQDALPRTIRPVHTPSDGDTVFALATGRRAGPSLTILGSIAADVLARAIERAVLTAIGAGGLPAARDLRPS